MSFIILGRSVNLTVKYSKNKQGEKEIDEKEDEQYVMQTSRVTRTLSNAQNTPYGSTVYV
jgi:hypothetical protein